MRGARFQTHEDRRRDRRRTGNQRCLDSGSLGRRATGRKPLVAVPAQNHAGLNITQSFLDRCQTARNKRMFRHLLDEIPIVAGGRTVAGERCHAPSWRRSAMPRARNDDSGRVASTHIDPTAPIEARSGPDTQRSWLPRMVRSSEAMSRAQTSRGQSGPDTQSPKLMVRSTWRRAISMSTASSAGRFPWISAMTAIRIPMLLDVGVTGRKLVPKPATMPLAD